MKNFKKLQDGNVNDLHKASLRNYAVSYCLAFSKARMRQ